MMEPRKRNKKRQVVPEDTDNLVGYENGNFQMNERLENELNLNEGELKMRELVQQKQDSENAFKVLSKVKSSASKWLSYATTRRFRRRPVKGAAAFLIDLNSSSMGDEAKESAGLGLDDIHDSFVSPAIVRQTSRKSISQKPVDCEMAVASNRALLQYFAKLGQSSDPSEVINLDFVHTLIASGADINCTDKYGQTILHEVARAWHIDVAKFLLEHGADINKGDTFGRSPLHYAAAVDYPAMVTLLIENGADKEARTTGECQTPVFFAAKTDAVTSLKVLINNGCLFKTERDYKGRTPIHVAAELDRSETARYLLQLQAPVWIPDKSGIRAITWMINKMAPVAYDALDQFHLTDRPNRKQQFYLNYLIRDEENDPLGRALTPLHVAVSYKLTDLLMHQVLLRFLDIQWNKFGRFWSLINLSVNLSYIILWTAIGMTVDYDKRHNYTLPDDIWRLVLYALAVCFTIYQVIDEVMEFRRSQRLHSEFEKKRLGEIEKDLQYAHPRWPMERKYLEQEMHETEKMRPKYFRDAWNIFDWICYIMLTICMATHVADVISHSDKLARTHIRLMCVTIILLWLRLMKNARAFSLLGPFVVMLGHMLKDFLKFMFLYLEFYIPFLAAFWMVFGGVKRNETDYNEKVIVPGYQFFGQTFFSLFRLTLVDEYDYGQMTKIDSVMADILLASWFILSSILCLNLFIALLSETFTRVYDKAEANAVMQKAITTLNIWEGISRSRKDRFHTYIKNFCSPLEEDYDDDMTQSEDDNIKKVTIEIKEELDNLQDMFKLQFGDPTSSLWQAENTTKFSLTKERFDSEVQTLKVAMGAIKEEQQNMKSEMQKDLTSVKSMLKKLLHQFGEGIETEGHQEGSVNSEVTPVTRIKRKKKKKNVDDFDTLEDISTTSTRLMDSQTHLDITSLDFSPATFPDLTRGVQAQVQAVPLSPPSSLSRYAQQQGTDHGNSTNC